MDASGSTYTNEEKDVEHILTCCPRSKSAYGKGVEFWLVLLPTALWLSQRSKSAAKVQEKPQDLKRCKQ